MIELRNDNPVFLMAIDVLGELQLVIGENADLVSERGVVFGESHYGFSFTTADNKKFLYPTQCPVVAADIANGNLIVFEEGKNIQWEIDATTGEVKKCAKFFANSRRDMRYLKEKFGLGPEDLERVNSYLEDIKKLEKI